MLPLGPSDDRPLQPSPHNTESSGQTLPIWPLSHPSFQPPGLPKACPVCDHLFQLPSVPILERTPGTFLLHPLAQWPLHTMLFPSAHRVPLILGLILWFSVPPLPCSCQPHGPNHAGHSNCPFIYVPPTRVFLSPGFLL